MLGMQLGDNDLYKLILWGQGNSFIVDLSLERVIVIWLEMLTAAILGERLEF